MIHFFWLEVTVLCIAYLPNVVFSWTQSRDHADRTELEMARNLVSFNDPATVWPLLPILGSLDDASYGIVSEALIHLLGRCGKWHTGKWSDEERLVLQDAEKWLANKYTRSDPELAQTVERALTPELPAGRPTLVRSTVQTHLSDGAACRDLIRRADRVGVIEDPRAAIR